MFHINKAFFSDNYWKVLILILLFLAIVKLPSILTTDIQPWDEGLYATRVSAIFYNGNFFDQSQESVGKFYSGSHPPLLIWIGYIASLIFGLNAVTLKLTVFIIGLLTVLTISQLGRLLFNSETGLLSAIIFSSNIIFNIFSKRFQFDIPFIFFVLSCFYFVFLYLKTDKKKYFYLSAVLFGLSLMIKILVGVLIPIILFVFVLFEKKLKNKDYLNYLAIGIIISLPWHIFMLTRYGGEFLDYFFGFHIYQRALFGVEHNIKQSGFLYYINYLFTIIPFCVLSFFIAGKNLLKLKILDSESRFITLWYIISFSIITFFKTKLESYSMLVIPSLSILTAALIINNEIKTQRQKILIIILLLINIIWFIFNNFRNEIIEMSDKNIPFYIYVIIFSAVFMTITICYLLYRKINLSKFLTIGISIYFIVINLYFAFKIPNWENTYEISSVKSYIENHDRKNIIYIGTNYRYNPQFSYYFNGLNLGWKNQKYNFELLDTKTGIDYIKDKLRHLEKEKYFIIFEKDNINRSEYTNASEIAVENLLYILTTRGYILYKN
jgi:4-amino-4-deoxy-L-arabinose transferase-like glycosyltransferase